MGEKNSDVVVIYGTCPSMDVARRLAGAMLEARLVACINLLPGMVSLYRWGGKMEEASEILLLAKTQNACLEPLKALFLELHPYEEPALVVLPVNDGLEGFLGWVADETCP